ncbi:hypothetical protein CON72_27670 [Bacillus wiedmannii]|nr:hypothetical protein CON72_27670 [Bacillus wiedmannii]
MRHQLTTIIKKQKKQPTLQEVFSVFSLYTIFKISKHNVSLSVEREKKKPTFTRESSFSVLWNYAFFIHSYYGELLGFSFIIEILEKLYEILHTLSVVFF